ncbi:MAG: hypothetical protein IT427_19125 [Pirellulales bacterium]|nr:hypothetical protein [Pirellulales bacterium]
MYRPPPNIVIQQLRQGVVESISYGKYTIHISFENGNRLSFTAPFRFGQENSLANSQVNDFPLSESRLIRVLGCTVVDVACEEDGTLRTCFSNGDVLIIYANDPTYEAYTLLIEGHEYVV